MAYDLQLGQSSRHVSGQYAYLLVSGDTVYYGDDVSVSASYNSGSLTPGQYLDQPGPAYLVSAGTSYIRQVDRATVSDASIVRPLDGGVPTYDATDRSFKFQAGGSDSVLNVRDFGATGDGVTDDTDAIHEAMDAAWQNGVPTSSTILFPPGTYIVTGLEVPISRLTLEGMNAASFNEGALTRRSVIKLKDASNKPVIKFTTHAVYSETHHFPRNCTLRGLMIDGNRAGQTTGDRYGIYCTEKPVEDTGPKDMQLWIQNCYIASCDSGGIKTGFERGGLRIFNSHIYDCGGHGIDLGYSDNAIIGCGIGRCGYDPDNTAVRSHDGIYVDTAWTTKIVNCDIWDCRSGVNLGPSSKSASVMNSMFDRHFQSGIYSSGTAHTITGNCFHKNSQLTDATYPHINMSGPDSTITGNTFFPAAGGNPPPIPSQDIYIAAGMECCVVGNNSEDGANTYGHLGIGTGGKALINKNVEIRSISAGVIGPGATDKWYVESELEVDGAFNHDGTTVGFYGTAPITKQTGVTVDAAGIHAALVALGLIAA